MRAGIRYAHGYGVSRDDQEAAKWYRQAADQGDGDAQHALGVMYDKWSIPEIVDTSEKRENARGGVLCHNDDATPNSSKKKPCAW